ncbi:hypothetical protein Q4508_10545 [Amphritea sp. 2_MG-2023]|uniref:hypothetical protein n=1 Tax=Amphritea sp. 2_MG-2023 TaxID=3062682 RepID=UPI0026E303EE|nr:hypothetical protein [Amphritea sp. 2_MG-2023]MDO6418997.1 hypothetical protein [Amphritea sp. 2_MG-2023]
MRSSLTLSASISIQGRGFSSPLRSSVATGDSVAGTRRTPPYLPWQVWVERLGASMSVGGKNVVVVDANAGSLSTVGRQASRANC